MTSHPWLVFKTAVQKRGIFVVVYGNLCHNSYIEEHLFVCAPMLLKRRSPLLDIVNREINALAHNTKDLAGI